MWFQPNWRAFDRWNAARGVPPRRVEWAWEGPLFVKLLARRPYSSSRRRVDRATGCPLELKQVSKRLQELDQLEDDAEIDMN